MSKSLSIHDLFLLSIFPAVPTVHISVLIFPFTMYLHIHLCHCPFSLPHIITGFTTNLCPNSLFNGHQPVHSITSYRGADKSLARPGRKQTRNHVMGARDLNKMETRAVIKFLFLQGKAPKEIHAILTETLAPMYFHIHLCHCPCFTATHHNSVLPWLHTF